MRFCVSASLGGMYNYSLRYGTRAHRTHDFPTRTAARFAFVTKRSGPHVCSPRSVERSNRVLAVPRFCSVESGFRAPQSPSIRFGSRRSRYQRTGTPRYPKALNLQTISGELHALRSRPAPVATFIKLWGRNVDVAGAA